MKKSSVLVCMLAGYGLYDLSVKFYKSGAMQDCSKYVKSKVEQKRKEKTEQSTVQVTAM